MRHRQGEIEIDPDELLLIVHYEDLVRNARTTSANPNHTILCNNLDCIVRQEEKKVRRRRIAIPSVDADPARLAKEILVRTPFACVRNDPLRA
jgi:hypothetical protein